MGLVAKLKYAMEHKPLTHEQTKELVMIWKRAAPFLEEQRERDIRASDTFRDIRAFDDVIEDALWRFPPSDTSGMVEMQKHFTRFARMASDKNESAP